MKKLSKAFALLALIGMMATSCSEEEGYLVNEQDGIEARLIATFEKSDLTENAMIISGISEKGMPIYELRDGWELAWSEEGQNSFSLKVGEELCKGSGVSFAKCVKEAVDDGKYVTVYKDKDGVYHGVEANCPPAITDVEG